jgi:IS30 family transposase
MGRERLTLEQRRELWARWRRGETMVEIGRVLGRSTPNVFQILRASGGISPRERQERSGSLCLGEREEISRGLAAGLSLRSIAVRLGRAPSTVSREVRHNGGRAAYRALPAQARALQCASRLCRCPMRRSIKACSFKRVGS